MSTPSPSADPLRARRAVLALVWLVAAAYLFRIHDRGWIPHDEGLLAHGAERVLAGELPHRDFDEVYTGGLDYVHAAALEVLGFRLRSLRLVLLLASLACVPVFFGIAARFLQPLAAGALVLVAGIWSLPSYFAPLPSWYVLFLALASLAALLRALDTGRRRWLFLAGFAGGLAFLVKSVGGVYIGAAGLVALVHQAQLEREPERDARAGKNLAWIALFALSLVTGLVLLVRVHLGAMEALHFVLPGAALAALLVWTEASAGGGTLRAGLVRRLVPFGAGLLLPIAVFLLPYALTGALDDFWRGVFVLPQRRLAQATAPLPPAWTLGTALPAGALLLFPRALARRAAFVTALVLAALLGVAIALPSFERAYALFWTSIRPLVPLSVVAGCAALARRDGALEPRRRAALLAVLASAAFLSLNQYPYSSAIYFCYVAPLAALAVAAAAASQPRAERRPALLLALLALYALFGVRWCLPGAVRTLGVVYNPRPDTEPLPLERAGLRVPRDHALVYPVVVEKVQAHSASGDPIYAAPDCPEIYFLADRENPTRTMYDFFDADQDEPAARRARVLARLEERAVNVVVVRAKGEFSGPIEPGLASELERRFPAARTVGNYTVRWRR